ncbi:MAG: C4-type zinc ribbon domain-containing protein [Acidobacteria bacterium]|nr:C4-type zinc ribbon domain-containing protein [Acidobacteriota bacterium]MCZ6770346.1 C4-type zinc ribbon domain-containing protein [Acidobacteriota bacterium]
MNSELGRLIRFQELNLKIVGLEERTKQIPEEVGRLTGTLEDSRQALEEKHQLIEEEQKRQRQLELEVETLRDRLSKFRGQLMEVKTNREYQAMLHEIEGTGKEIEEKEDQMLEGMMAIEEREELARQANEVYQREEKEVSEKRSKLERSATQAESEIAELQKHRRQLEREIPEGLNQQFQRIASVRNGVALAEAKDQSCQACHVKLRPQHFSEVKTNQKIMTCENCNRFLYYAGS